MLLNPSVDIFFWYDQFNYMWPLGYRYDREILPLLQVSHLKVTRGLYGHNDRA